MDKLLKYKRLIFYALVAIILSATLVARLASHRKSKGEHDFLQAPLSLAEGRVDELEEIFTRHSELRPKYDGPIAQFLIKANEPEMATLYAEQMLGRTSNYASLYADFSKTTLLIENGRYTTALTQALSLQKELAPKEDSLLKLYNLLRIALLQQELGDKSAEKEAWSRLLQEFSEKPNPTQQTFLNTFQRGNITLIQYAKNRLG